MLTPRAKIGGRWYRLHLFVSKEDEAKIGRGPGWKCTVEEVSGIGTGRKWRIKAASCGIESCYCDAIAEEVRPLAKDIKTPRKRRVTWDSAGT